MNFHETFNIYESYEHLRNLVSLCHEEEYAEYIIDYPENPFHEDSFYNVEVQHIIAKAIADVIASGSCEDMIEILYFAPKAKEDIYGDTILGNH